MSKSDHRPIGVFDSGAGGLTVLKELLKHFPQESFTYLGDTARLPYGSKSPETITRYSQQIMRKLKEMDVKAIVIACNSASTVCKNQAQFEGLPVYNVITPGAQQAIANSENMRIGVVGTNATINSQAYTKAIMGLTPAAQVFSQACPLWVPLAEEGWQDDPITNLIVYRYLQPLLQENIDTLILGCTHYSLLIESISKATEGKITLVDSGQAICHWLEQDISSGRVDSNQEKETSVQIHLTDTNPQFQGLAEKLLGSHHCQEISHIDL